MMLKVLLILKASAMIKKLMIKIDSIEKAQGTLPWAFFYGNDNGAWLRGEIGRSPLQVNLHCYPLRPHLVSQAETERLKEFEHRPAIRLQGG